MSKPARNFVYVLLIKLNVYYNGVYLFISYRIIFLVFFNFLNMCIACAQRLVTLLFGCRNVMLRVNAKQGAPKDGNSLLESLQVTFTDFILFELFYKYKSWFAAGCWYFYFLFFKKRILAWIFHRCNQYYKKYQEIKNINHVVEKLHDGSIFKLIVTTLGGDPVDWNFYQSKNINKQRQAGKKLSNNNTGANFLMVK